MYFKETEEYFSANYNLDIHPMSCLGWEIVSICVHCEYYKMIRNSKKESITLGKAIKGLEKEIQNTKNLKPFNNFATKCIQSERVHSFKVLQNKEINIVESSAEIDKKLEKVNLQKLELLYKSLLIQKQHLKSKSKTVLNDVLLLLSSLITRKTGVNWIDIARLMEYYLKWGYPFEAVFAGKIEQYSYKNSQNEEANFLRTAREVPSNFIEIESLNKKICLSTDGAMLRSVL